MTHREARLLLADLAEGQVDGAAHEELLRHLQGCSECAGWLTAYRALREGLRFQGAGGGHEEHPSSDLLARWVVSRTQIEPYSQREVLHHLRACDTCRDEARWSAAALREARDGESPSRYPRLVGPPGSERRSTWWRGAAVLAASAAIVLILVARPHPTEHRLPQRAVVDADGEEDSELRGRELGGQHRIEGGRTLTLRDVRVLDGAEITFTARQRLALGDGFAIGSGSRVVFETAAREHQEAEPGVPEPGDRGKRNRS